MLDGKRIYELSRLTNIVNDLVMVVDNPAFQEAEYITVGQLLASLNHQPVTLGTPNGLHLVNQELSLRLSSKLTAGALSQLPEDNPIYKFVNGENKWVYCYANNIVGGHHSYATIAERDAIPEELRNWGMQCTVFNNSDIFLNGTYTLQYNRVDTNINNNNNWAKTDKMTIRVLNSYGDVITNTPKGLSSPVLFIKYVSTNTVIYKIAYPSYYFDSDGAFHWHSGILIEDGYLLLI